MKELFKKIKKRIEKSNIAKFIMFKKIINDLEKKIGVLEKDKQKLNDRVRKLNLEVNRLEEYENKVPSMELVIASSDKSLKNKMEEIKKLQDDKLNIQNELFKVKMELACSNIQKEEYEAQIEDLKSDRYLIRKVPSGRTPNTNKTKISKPMSGNVTRYMRGEHEYNEN